MELKEKLARWAGFTFLPYEYYPNLGKLNDSCWLEPSHTRQVGSHWSFSAPNFPESLDLCFEWLVPKIDMLWNIEFQLLDKGYVAVLEYGSDREIVSKAETPSLALCKAIEQYIDQKEL